MTDISKIVNGQSMKNIREDILNPLIDVVNTQIPANATAIQSAVASATHATELAQTAQQEASSAGTKADAAKTESAAAKQAVEEVKTNYLDGIHIEDEHNHVVDKAKRIVLSGVELEQQDSDTAVIRATQTITVSDEASGTSTKTVGGYLAIPGAVIEQGDEGKAVVITFPAGSHALLVADRSGTEHGAKKLVFPTASIFEGQDEGTFVVDTGIGVSQTGESEIQNVTSFEFDGCTVEDITPQGEEVRKVRITPDLTTIPKKAPPSYLAYFGNPTFIGYSEGTTPTDRKDIIYPDEIIVDSNDTTRLLPDKDGMAFTLSKLEGFDESDYLVSVRIAFRKAQWDWAWNQGFIRLSLQDVDGNVVTDAYGVPMSIEHSYNPGDYIGAIQLTSILRVTNPLSFQIITETNLSEVQPVITPRNEDTAGILIQSLTYLSKTSDAMQQFEHDVGEQFPLAFRIFGSDLFNFDYLNSPDRGPFVEGHPSALWRSDGQLFHSVSGFNWKVLGGEFQLTDNGSPLDCSFAKVFDTVSTRFLRGQVITVTAETAHDLSWEIGLLKWTGAPDAVDTELYSGRVMNQPPTWKAGWTFIDSINLQVTDTDVFEIRYGTLTVPEDAVQFAIILFPRNTSMPAYLKMRSIKGTLPKTLTEWYLGAQKTIGEPSSKKLNDLITYVQDNQGVAGISYPITNAQTPIPFGKLVTWHDTVPAPGVNPVTATAVNQRPGEGGVLFEKEGVLEFSPTQLLIVNTGATSQTVTFKYKVKHLDGSIEDVPGSSTVFTVRGNNGSGQFFRMKSFNYHCKVSDTLFLVAVSSGANGLKLFGLNAAYPMVKGSLVYKKILPSSYDTPVSTPYAFGVAQVDTADTKYAPATANVAATVPLNTLYTGDAVAVANVTFDNANDSVKVLTTGLMKLDYKAHIIRTQQWNAAVKYALWVEKSVDNGVTWTKVDGSVSRINIPSDYPATAIPLTVTFPTVVTVAGTRFRVRHIADTIVNGVGLQSYAASGDFPAAASIQLTGTFI